MSDKMKKELLIIIPAYNEEENLSKLLKHMFKSGIDKIGDILVVNDGSIDNTELVARQSNVSVMSLVCNMGYGSALQVGYKYASKMGYEYVIQMDADGQHDICNISKIYECLKQNGDSSAMYDIVIGSRFLSDESTFKVSILKNITISFFKLIIKMVTNFYITDPTSGLQGLNRKTFTYYAKYGNFDYKYPDINMIIQMLMLGYTIKEIPAVMHERENGKSMHSGIIRPIKYMVIISLSTLSIILRSRKESKK